jgi:HEPN domain-containing protein
VNRSDWQQIATERIADAKALLAASRWSAAYYLAGYAVECGLKACVVVRVAAGPEIMFIDRKYSDKCWTHNLIQLVDLAGLKATFDADKDADTDLLSNWDIVKDWSEESRYLRTPKGKAQQMYDALTNKRHGVLQWIKVHW